MQSIKLAASILALSAGLAGTATAASYGNFIDPTGTVQYLNVSDLNGLFGAPEASLNSLDFTPTRFNAQCTQCPTGVTVSDTLSLDIQAVPGQRIDLLEISEGLDFTIQSFDPAGFASATVSSNVIIDVIQLDGIAVSGISAVRDILYTPAPNPTVSGFGTQIGVILGTTSAIDVDSIIAGAGAFGEATRVRISFSNTLQAFHDGSGGQALIRKRDADFVSLTVAVNNVPEPTTAVLMMGGLALLAGRRPRT